jgi:hypothetical protein
MKPFSNLFTLVALCFCMVSTSNAQVQYETRGSRVMEAQAWTTVTGDPYFMFSDSAGQSLQHPGGLFHSIEMVAADFFSLDSVVGTLTVYADHVYGQIVMVKDVWVPGMLKYSSSNVLASISQSEMYPLINEVFAEAADGTRTFDQMSKEYVIDTILPAGNYVFILRVDGTVTHVYPGGGSHRSHMGFAGNYSILDPYPAGFALLGGCIGQGGDSLRELIVPDMFNWSPDGLTIDMAFEFNVLPDLSTSISTESHKLPPVILQNGSLIIAPEWSGTTVTVSDVTGKTLLNQLVRGGEIFELPKNQMVFITQERDGRVRTDKVIVAE